MLRDELRRAMPSLRVARAGGACPLAVFSAHLSTAAQREALLSALIPMGMTARVDGSLALICPQRALAQALCALARGRVEGPLARIYPQPAQLCLEHAALLREFGRLPAGFDEAHLELIAQGLRLVEGPHTHAQLRAYQTRVRQEAALSLRLSRPGGALLACAYLIVQGGMLYEA